MFASIGAKPIVIIIIIFIIIIIIIVIVIIIIIIIIKIVKIKQLEIPTWKYLFRYFRSSVLLKFTF